MLIRMDELIINQTKYISSKRASQESGYARDYIGQLIRQGKLEAKRMGRAWYVSEVSLMKLTSPTTAAAASTINRFPVVASTVEYAMPKTWSEIRYMPDDRDLFPVSDSRVAVRAPEMTNVSNASHTETTQAPERVKITVIRPQRVAASPTANLSAGMMGVRMPTRSGVFAPALQQSRRIRLPGAQTLGVLTGAVVFLVLLPLFI